MNQQEPKAPQVPLVAYTMSAVRKSDGGPEKYILPPAGRRVVEAATRALMQSSASAKEQRAALKQVLAIAHTLKTKFASPAAARALTDAVTCLAKAAQLLGLETKSQRSRQRNMTRFLGGSTVRRAPALAPAAPIGSMRLSSMLVARTREYR